MSAPRVAAVHFTPALGATEANREALVALAREAAARADVVVLPELATSGFRLDAALAARCAEPADGPTARALGAVAREQGAVVVVGLPLRDADGVLFNAQLVLERDGALAGVYRKRHLYGDDAAWATAGPRPGALVRTSAGALGLLICHDVVYPETLLGVAAQGPALLAFSTNWIGDGEAIPESWSFAVRVLDPAPLVVANRGGAEGDVAFGDPSAILAYRAGGVVGARGAAPYVLTWPR